MTPLVKQFSPSKKRLMDNAFRMMMSAEDQWFKDYWTKVYIHLCKQFNKLN